MKNLITIKNTFKNKDLFDQALTHKSWVNENQGKRESNERLEFLGDAVLELVVTDYLYKDLPDKSEGYLTALRANIVNTVNLARFANEIDLANEIYLSTGEKKSGKKSSPLLADTIEAIIGAIYIDQGIESAKTFIIENLLKDLDKKIKEPLKDSKSMLQEKVQSKGLLTPKYSVVNIVGPDHDRKFTIQVLVAGKVLGKGTGKNKSEAEQKAAKVALKKLNM